MKIHSKFVCLAILLVFFLFYFFSPFTQTVTSIRLQVFDLLNFPLASLSTLFEYMSAMLNIDSLIETNEELRNKLAETRTELYQISYLRHENKKLRQLLELKDSVTYKTVSAEVIARNKKIFSSTAILNKGINHGIRQDFYVINEEGLVGKIIEVSDRTSKVLFLDDINFKITASFGDAEEIGLVKGSAVNNVCVFKYLSIKSSVDINEKVVTSSINLNLPDGIPIGTINKLAVSDDNFFYEGLIQTSVDFKKVKYVLVIIG